MYYQCILASQDKSLLAKEIQTTEPKPEYEKIIKDPYVMEFLQIQPDTHVYEGELEQALIDHLQHFLLELGRGFLFVARKNRFTLDGQDFFIDLVFYNYILKCFVLIDLKMGKLTHQNLGQMQMYVNYYTREMMNDGDTPPIGIVLCADKGAWGIPNKQRQEPDGYPGVLLAMTLTWVRLSLKPGISASTASAIRTLPLETLSPARPNRQHPVIR